MRKTLLFVLFITFFGFLRTPIVNAAEGNVCYPSEEDGCTPPQDGGSAYWSCACGGPCPGGQRCIFTASGDYEHYACFTEPEANCPLPEDCDASKALECGEDGGCSSPTRRCEFVGGGEYACVDNPGECSETCDSAKIGECGDAGGCNSSLKECQETADGFYQCNKNLEKCAGSSGVCEEATVGKCGELGGCDYDSWMCLKIVEHGDPSYYCGQPTPEDEEIYGTCGASDDTECGMAGTDGECGADGGCDIGFRCDAQEDPPVCESDGTCTDPVCSPIGSCGPENGCPEGQLCTRTQDEYGNPTGPNYCYAGEDGIPTICTEVDPFPNEYNGPILTITQLITLIYRILLPVAVGFGIFFVIKAGYTIKTSEGDPAKKKQGFEELLAALTGTAFVGVALTVLRVIISQIIGG